MKLIKTLNVGKWVVFRTPGWKTVWEDLSLRAMAGEERRGEEERLGLTLSSQSLFDILATNISPHHTHSGNSHCLECDKMSLWVSCAICLPRPVGCWILYPINIYWLRLIIINPCIRDPRMVTETWLSCLIIPCKITLCKHTLPLLCSLKWKLKDFVYAI